MRIHRQSATRLPATKASRERSDARVDRRKCWPANQQAVMPSCHHALRLAISKFFLRKAFIMADLMSALLGGDRQAFQALLSSLMSAENSARSQAENAFQELQKQPDVCANLLIQGLRSSDAQELRSLSAVLLRRVRAVGLWTPRGRKNSQSMRKSSSPPAALPRFSNQLP